MLLLEIVWTRFISVFIMQIVVSIIFLFLSYRIISRNMNRIALTASFFYIFISIGLIINLFYYNLTVNPLVYILHFMAVYMVFYGAIFLVLFTLIWLKSEKIITLRKELIIIIIYGFVLFVILLIPGGITINESTNWRPKWSWPLLIALYLFFTFSISIPFFYISVRLFKSIQTKLLRRKLKFYTIGSCGFIIMAYGLILSNTWINPIFRVAWSFISLSGMLFSFLIYSGIARQL